MATKGDGVAVKATSGEATEGATLQVATLGNAGIARSVGDPEVLADGEVAVGATLGEVVGRVAVEATKGEVAAGATKVPSVCTAVVEISGGVNALGEATIVEAVTE